MMCVLANGCDYEWRECFLRCKANNPTPSSEVNVEDVARIIDPELDAHLENQAFAKCRALVAIARGRAEEIAALYAPIVAERDETLRLMADGQLFRNPDEDPMEFQRALNRVAADNAVLLKLEAAEARAEALQAQVEGAKRAFEEILLELGFKRDEFILQGPMMLIRRLEVVATFARQALSTLSGGEK
jgi:hypothetical protein